MIDDTEAAFLEAMRAAGIDIDAGGRGGPHPVADGKLHRADAVGKKRKQNWHGWYVLYPDHPASGAFGDYQTGESGTWTVTKPEQMSATDREALKARMEEARRQRAEELDRTRAEAAKVAEKIWSASHKASPDHAYLANKNLPPFPGLRQLDKDVRYAVDGENKTAKAGSLVVPMYRPDGARVGVQLIKPDGWKGFLKGGQKKGCYTSVGKPGDVLVIAEGWATAARIHQATSHCVIVAFDSGNLAPVGAAIRKKYPDAKIIIAADNDRFTRKPDGTPVNPGVEAAKDAAGKIGALVATPLFDDADEKSTDFDDMFRTGGLAEIAERIAAASVPAHVETRKPAPEPEPVTDDGPPPYDPDEPMPVPDDGPADAGAGYQPWDRFGEPYFRCLGVDETTMFYQPYDVGQVIALKAREHSSSNMLALAGIEFWEQEFPAKTGVNWTAAVNACIRACKAQRKFVPHNRVRGRGAWFEGERSVFHAGDHLVIDGKRVPIHQHRGRGIYNEGASIPVALDDPATTPEARKFLEVCKSLRWNSPLSGYLLAGFCVIAPVCGFLKWRPHVWVNGPAGSGKSTVIEKIVSVALKEVGHSILGASTEAGIRQRLEYDALPVIFDEAEPKDMASQSRMKAIMDLARVASSESEGMIVKGTAGHSTKSFKIRTMFIFASINSQIEGFADETRMTQLSLSAAEASTEEEKEANKRHYEKLVSDITAVLTPRFARRILARTISNLPILREYVEVFTRAAEIHLGMRRLADQLGPLLAGAYILNTTKPITVEAALEWIRKNDWGEHTAVGGERDNARFLQTVMSSMVRHSTPEFGIWERTVGELIDIAATEPETLPTHDGLSREVNKTHSGAVKELARAGIKLIDDDGFKMVRICTSDAIKKRFLQRTEWAGANIRQILKSVPGAVVGARTVYFAPGLTGNYVDVPFDALIGDSTAPAPEPEPVVEQGEFSDDWIP